MILLDFSNIIVGSIMVSSRVPNEERFSEDFIRHLVLNSIRSYRKKYHKKYGEATAILAGDSLHDFALALILGVIIGTYSSIL